MKPDLHHWRCMCGEVNNPADHLTCNKCGEHGCVSAFQHWYLDSIDVHLQSEWNAYFDEG